VRPAEPYFFFFLGAAFLAFLGATADPPFLINKRGAACPAPKNGGG
jgi:hypothetical protein